MMTNLESITNHPWESSNGYILSFSLYLSTETKERTINFTNNEKKEKKKKSIFLAQKNKKQIENQLLLIMKMNINQQIKEKNNLSFSYWQEKIGIKNFFWNRKRLLVTATQNWEQGLKHLSHWQNPTHKIIVLQWTTHRNEFSRKTTGSGSLMAAFSRPRASSDEYGANTFKPGHEAYHAAKHCTKSQTEPSTQSNSMKVSTLVFYHISAILLWWLYNI